MRANISLSAEPRFCLSPPLPYPLPPTSSHRVCVFLALSCDRFLDGRKPIAQACARTLVVAQRVYLRRFPSRDDGNPEGKKKEKAEDSLDTSL